LTADLRGGKIRPNPNKICIFGVLDCWQVTHQLPVFSANLFFLIIFQNFQPAGNSVIDKLGLRETITASYTHLLQSSGSHSLLARKQGQALVVQEALHLKQEYDP
jgi:hypothetical protein